MESKMPDAQLFEPMKRFAETGNNFAKVMLANCYGQGVGVEQNSAVAFVLVKEAFDNDYELARGLLGMIYFLGDGVEKQQELGKNYLSRFASVSDQAKFIVAEFYYGAKNYRLALPIYWKVIQTIKNEKMKDMERQLHNCYRHLKKDQNFIKELEDYIGGKFDGKNFKEIVHSFLLAEHYHSV